MKSRARGAWARASAGALFSDSGLTGWDIMFAVLLACVVLLVASSSSFAYVGASFTRCKTAASATSPDKKQPEESYGTESKAKELLRYYSGLVNDPITDLQTNEEMANCDNLTPNLRLAAIFSAILLLLVEAFFKANEGVAPFSP